MNIPPIYQSRIPKQKIEETSPCTGNVKLALGVNMKKGKILQKNTKNSWVHFCDNEKKIDFKEARATSSEQAYEKQKRRSVKQTGRIKSIVVITRITITVRLQLGKRR